MRKILVVGAMLVAMTTVASADIADREHDDSNTAQVVQAILNLSDRIEELKTQLVVVTTKVDEMPTPATPSEPSVCNPTLSAPKSFRQYRTTKKGKKLPTRFVLEAVN